MQLISVLINCGSIVVLFVSPWKCLSVPLGVDTIQLVPSVCAHMYIDSDLSSTQAEIVSRDDKIRQVAERCEQLDAQVQVRLGISFGDCMVLCVCAVV